MRHKRSGILLVCLTGLAGTAAVPAGAQARPEADSTTRAVIAAGDEAWSRGARDSAYALYRVVVQRDSGASTRALFRLGLIEAERHRLDAAANLLRGYVRREPGDDEGRLALARILAWHAHYDESIAVYDDVLARDATDREAVIGRAQALAWASRLPEALASYQRWLSYAPGDADAQKGVARVVAWQGDLAESERLWRTLTRRYPDDAEAWIGLAQVQRWAGHAALADSAIGRALELAPSSTEARQERQRVLSDLAGSAEPVIVHTSDSDGNRSTSYAVTMATRSSADPRLRVTGMLRETDLQLAHAASAGAWASMSWASPGGRLAATAELGAIHLSGPGIGSAPQARTRAHLLLRLSGALRPRTTIGVTVSQLPFDETTPLIAGAIGTTATAIDLQLEPWRGLMVGLDAGRATINGGRVPNDRIGGGGLVRWAVRPGRWLAATARRIQFDTTAPADGYFSPHRFSLLELSAGTSTGRDRVWGATLEAGAGRQAVQLLSSDPGRSSPAARASIGLWCRPVPGYEVEAVYGISSVASAVAQQAADYRARSLSVRGRLRL